MCLLLGSTDWICEMISREKLWMTIPLAKKYWLTKNRLLS
jgi:hypothetical protein